MIVKKKYHEVTLVTASFWGKDLSDQKEKINDFLEYLSGTECSSITIIVACELQRFAVMNARNCTEDDALEFIHKEKIVFVNMLNELVNSFQHNQQLSNSDDFSTKKSDIKHIEIQDWIKQRQLTGYENNLNAITSKYLTDENYKRSIQKIAVDFQSHYGRSSTSKPYEEQIENNIKHVIEELAVLSLWKFDVILHPVKENKAMQIVKKDFSVNYEYYTMKMRQKKDMVQTYIDNNQIFIDRTIKKLKRDLKNQYKEELQKILEKEEQKRLQYEEQQRLQYKQQMLQYEERMSQCILNMILVLNKQQVSDNFQQFIDFGDNITKNIPLLSERNFTSKLLTNTMQGEDISIQTNTIK